MADEETNELARDLGSEIGDLRLAVSALAGSLRRSRLTSVLLASALAVTVLLCVAVGYLAVRTSSSVSCIRDWGNASSQRTTVLTRLSNSRQDALDTVLRDLLAAKPDQATVLRDSQVYLKVSDQYRQATKDNPPQALPSFSCPVL